MKWQKAFLNYYQRANYVPEHKISGEIIYPVQLWQKWKKKKKKKKTLSDFPNYDEDWLREEQKKFKWGC